MTQLKNPIYPMTLIIVLGGIMAPPESWSANPPLQTVPPATIDVNTIIENGNNTNKPIPILTFKFMEHDFGTLLPRSKHTCTFFFTNTGQALLTLQKTVRSSCGCAVPSLQKNKYAPGESGTIVVSYHDTGATGSFTKKLYVQSNDPLHPTITLTLKMHIQPPIEPHPKSLELYIKGPKSHAPLITLKSTDGHPFAISSIMATGQVMRATCDPNQRGTSLTLSPILDPNQLRNHPNGYLLVNVIHPQTKQIKIPFRTLPEFRITPASVIAFQAEPNKPIHKNITIINQYQEAFTIEDINAPNLEINAIPRVPSIDFKTSSLRHEIQLTLIPLQDTEKKRSISHTITLHLSNKRKLRLPVRIFFSRTK